MLSRGDELKLKKQTWTIVGPLNADRAGFGTLYEVGDQQGNEAVAKLVRKDPGAERELLIGAANQAARHRNVIPVLDDGEHGDDWVLVMSRADKSLAQYLNERGGSLEVGEAVAVLRDIAIALADINGALVHRDLKPQNVLLLDGSWHLADFGISRYAEATTAADTQKYSWTPPYAAPEQWRMERATPAADVYAFGVMGYQLLAGERPFPGPDFRSQHLNDQPPPLTVGSTRLRDLVEECLYKAPETRPTPTAIQARLEKVTSAPAGTGLEKLAQANRGEVSRRSAEDAQLSAAREREEWRGRLHTTAVGSFARISEELIEAIRDHAPTAEILTDSNAVPRAQSAASGKAFLASLGGAQLGLGKPIPTQRSSVPFTVISESEITVTRNVPVYGWLGRRHSLWFCDVEEKERFAWYEVAFMDSPFTGSGQGQIDPFSLSAREAHQALQFVMGTMQVARDFEHLDRSELSSFVNRWLGWFGDAALGQLSKPMMMPEGSVRMDRWWLRK